MKYSCNFSQVNGILEGLIFTTSTMKRIREIFESEMELGLALNPKVKSSLQMANTFIPQLPNGTGMSQSD